MIGLAAIIVAYLVGGIPFGLLIVKLRTGMDVRESGSGNIGATNVLRTAGTLAGVLTLILDAAKGLFAVWLADTLTHGDLMWMSFAALAALLGHAFSPYLKFKGGKAVASFLGAFGYLTPVPVLIVLLIFLLVVVMTRYLSLGSVTGAALYPFACFVILHPAWPILVAAAGAAVLIVYRHAGNIARIREGNERILSFEHGIPDVRTLAVIGGGGWGTALSCVLAPRFSEIRLWVKERDLAERMRASRVNDVFLAGFTLPDNVLPGYSLESAMAGADVIVSAMPSHVVREVYEEMSPWLTPTMRLVSATKGLESGSLLRMSEVIRAVVGDSYRVAVLSGPSFAREVADGSPTAVVAASEDPSLATEIQNGFSGPTFRVYAGADPVGVEIGGALKNVIAIGAGICDGLGMGHNAVAALITRGLAELTRLAVAAGGQTETLSGLAGLGDLVLTCTGNLSRNRKVGLQLADGIVLERIIHSTPMVAEGIRTTSAAVELARRFGVEMPITAEMHAVLNEGRAPVEAIRRLMGRAPRAEFT